MNKTLSIVGALLLTAGALVHGHGALGEDDRKLPILAAADVIEAALHSFADPRENRVVSDRMVVHQNERLGHHVIIQVGEPCVFQIRQVTANAFGDTGLVGEIDFEKLTGGYSANIAGHVILHGKPGAVCRRRLRTGEEKHVKVEFAGEECMDLAAFQSDSSERTRSVLRSLAYIQQSVCRRVSASERRL